mmetsp:Transcript_72495/g.115023  ORF Transcript_72495/g.115023 Transcript_72495/m.115023 type:complete len:217 (-) Transcript_72495:747-1397(-)
MDYAGLGQGPLAAIDLVPPCTRAVLRRSLLSQSKSHALLLPVVDCVIFLQQWLPQNESLFSQARRWIHRQQGGTTHQLHFLLFVDHLHGCGPGVFAATEGHGNPTVQFKDQLWAFHIAAVDVILDPWRHLPCQLPVEWGGRSAWGTDEGGARVSDGHTGTVRTKGKVLAIHCDSKNLHLPESFVGLMDWRPLQGGAHVTYIVAAEANLTGHIVPFR